MKLSFRYITAALAMFMLFSCRSAPYRDPYAYPYALHSEKEKFSILLPEEPRVKKQSERTAFGISTYRFYITQNRADSYVVLLGIENFPAALKERITPYNRKELVNKIFNNAIQGTMEESKNQGSMPVIDSSTELLHGKSPAREVKIISQDKGSDQKRFSTIRLIFSNERLYMIMLMGHSPQAVQKGMFYVESFRLHDSGPLYFSDSPII